MNTRLLENRHQFLTHVRAFMHDTLIKPLKGHSSPHYVISVCIVTHLFFFVALLTISQGYVNALSHYVNGDSLKMMISFFTLLGYFTAALGIPLWYGIALYRSASNANSLVHVYHALSGLAFVIFIGQLSKLAHITGITSEHVFMYVVNLIV